MLHLALAALLSCPVAAEKPMLETQLLFGRDIPGGGEVSDRQWTDFVAQTIAKEFPSGFSVSDAAGVWRSPHDGSVVHEPSKIVLIVAKRSPDLARKLERVSAAYRAQFHQEAVGMISREVCAAF